MKLFFAKGMLGMFPSVHPLHTSAHPLNIFPYITIQIYLDYNL